MSLMSKKLKRIFAKHQTQAHFKPTNTLWQKLIHPKDPTAKEKISSEEFSELYTGQTKQSLHKRMHQHRRDNTLGPVLDKTTQGRDNT